MSLKFQRLRLLPVLGILLSASWARAGSIYSVSVIETPSGWTGIEMSGINNSGQVTGTVGTQAFVGTTSGSTIVPLPSGWTEAFGYAINASGLVAGYGFTATGGEQAFVGTTSGSTAVPLPAGIFETYGYAINDSGQVAGYGTNGSGSSQAFIATTSGSTVIPPPIAYAFGINDSGEVAGYGWNPQIFNDQAFIGTTSGSIPLPSGGNTVGYAINDSGEVAGTAYGNDHNGNVQQTSLAFIGTTSGVTAIPLPLGATTAAVTLGSINDSGVVVGYSDAGGWIYSSGGTDLLNTLVAAGWNITDAISISNNGLVLAQGSFEGGPTEYVELSPASAPEPEACLLVGSGLLLMFGASRRYRKCHTGSSVSSATRLKFR